MVTFTSITPASGTLAGGTAVTIVGTGFTAGMVVLIGGLLAGNIKVVSATEITAITPPNLSGAVGNADVVLAATASLIGAATGAAAFSYTAAGLAVWLINPNTGPDAGGTTVTIVGTGFSAGTVYVAIGAGMATDVNVVSDTVLTCTIPSNALAGSSDSTHDVILSYSAGLSDPVTLVAAFTFTTPVAPPAVTLVDSDGGRWNIVVDTSGNLSTVPA